MSSAILKFSWLTRKSFPNSCLKFSRQHFWYFKITCHLAHSQMTPLFNTPSMLSGIVVESRPELWSQPTDFRPFLNPLQHSLFRAHTLVPKGLLHFFNSVRSTVPPKLYWNSLIWIMSHFYQWETRKEYLEIRYELPVNKSVPPVTVLVRDNCLDSCPQRSLEHSGAQLLLGQTLFLLEVPCTMFIHFFSPYTTYANLLHPSLLYLTSHWWCQFDLHHWWHRSHAAEFST